MTLLDIMSRRRTEKFLDEAMELTDDWQGTKNERHLRRNSGSLWAGSRSERTASRTKTAYRGRPT